MKEWSEHDLRSAVQEGTAKGFGVFFYTPTCGTCKVAERMLGIVEVMLPQLPLYKVNVNLAPGLVQEWQIRSVPCTAIIRQGQPVAKRYRMGDTAELYRFYRELTID